MDGCHTTPPLRGDPERQWGGRILPVGRSLDGAFSHPLYVDNRKVSCKEIQILTGSDKRLIAQELEGTGLKNQGQEDLIRVGQEGLSDSTTTITFLKRG